MKYPRADAVGEEWQALAVESAQTEIKLIAKNAVLTDKPFDTFRKEYTEVINDLVKELDSESLALKCKKALPPFALRVYTGLIRIFGISTPNNMAGLATLMGAGGDLGAEALIAANTMPRITAREWAYNRATPNYTYYKQVERTIVQNLREIVAMEAKPDYETNVNLRNVAEMEARYVHQVNMMDGMKQRGIDLVWIKPHANCSKRCEKYQGRLYSLSGKWGKVDGIVYAPITEATNNPRDRYTTKAGITYQNGCITGFGCRHELDPYVKGNKPAMIPANVIRRQRHLEEEQRRMERNIRRARETTLLLSGIGAGKAYKASLDRQVRLRKQYEEFSKKHRIPFYSERLKVLEGEQLRSTVKVPKSIYKIVPEEARKILDARLRQT